MALIKNAIAREIAREAIVLDLGDLHRQGSVLVEQARRQAAAVLAEARAERDRIVAGAAEDGHSQGLARGLIEGRVRGAKEALEQTLAEERERLAALESSWQAALGRFESERDEMLFAARHDIVRLAALIAERVTKRRIALDPRVVEDQMRAVLEVVVRPSALSISIHPEDRAVVERALPSLMAAASSVRHVELRDDPRLSRGSCVARTRAAAAEQGAANPDEGGGGEIDASIETQVQRIVSVLLPEATATSGEATQDRPEVRA